jgi:DNA invertase Pin-like site-specific DNA recombinase
MTRYAYQRTSTSDQDGLGQRARLLDAGIDAANLDPFTDTGLSGMKASRPGLDKLLSVLVSGDSVTITELSRLGRSVPNVLALVEDLDQRGVSLVILNLGGSVVDTSTAMGRFFVGILSVISRLERDLVSERTRATLAAKKADGVVLGAPKKITAAQLSAARKMRAAKMRVPDIAVTLGVKQSTLYRALAAADG